VKLIIVSNRLPVTVVLREGGAELREAVGGLATAVRSFLRATEGGRALGFSEVLWVGWSGVRAEAETAEVRSMLRDRGLVPVPLSGDEVNLFYEGFCNSTLWPLLHGFTVYTQFERKFWDAYVGVNQKFADAVASLAEPGISSGCTTTTSCWCRPSCGIRRRSSPWASSSTYRFRPPRCSSSSRRPGGPRFWRGPSAPI
jgi:trehalose 6-phosphate synthase (EC 2.4.1.15)/trehalose 6-phosphatase (EC 3.1.3.12)